MIEKILLKPTGERLDVILTRELQELEYDITRSDVTKAFSEKRVLWQGKNPKAGLKVDQEMLVTIEIPDEVEISYEPENIPLDIVYEDEDILVINKPRGMVVHPAPGHPTGTLVHALLYHCGRQNLSSVNGQFRPGIVHRIDKDTSGLLVVAKNNAAHRKLAEDLAAHDIRRVYHAIVYGSFSEESGRVEAPIGRDTNNRQKMTVTAHGKEATTLFLVEENLSGYSHLRLDLLTGRTHQIRVHMQYIGHPVVGDPVYAQGRKHQELGGQLLHAAELHLTHPRTGEEMVFEAALPDVMMDFLAAYR